MVIRLSFVILIAIVLGYGYSVKAQESPCQDLIWADEFEADGAPDAQKWDYDLGGGGWGNNELQTYTNKRTNSWVKDGRLYLKALKTDGNWTSARLVTRGKGDWLYGRIEVRAKLPMGKGTWPAIWMLPTDWEYGGWPASGEIDIMEHVGYDPGVVHGTIHTEAYNHSIGTQKGASIGVEDAMANFHVYAIEWDEDLIRWYVDDVLYFSFNNEHRTYKEWPFDQRFHLLLNIAVGGNWGGAEGIDPGLTEVLMEVDYVRVYGKQLPTPVIQGKAVLRPGDEATFRVGQLSGAVYDWSWPDGVEPIEGEGTHEVKVRWGNDSGEVGVELRTSCNAMKASPVWVDVIHQPEGNQLEIDPVDEANQLLWEALAGTGNTLNLTAEDDVLRGVFEVNAPSENPHVDYLFEGLMDLTAHAEIAFDLQVDADNPPSNMRFDLVDVNGQVNAAGLFKLDVFESDGEFHSYSHVFDPGADHSFLLDQIAQIRVYFNYGIFGKKGSGQFQLKNLRLQVANSTTAPEWKEQQAWKIYPNPATDWVILDSEEDIQKIEVFSSAGVRVKTFQPASVRSFQFQVNDFTAGVYLISLNQRFTKVLSVQ